MKKVVYFFVAGLLLAIISCGKMADNDASLNTLDDSLSYSAGVYMAQELPNIIYEELGVDSADIEDFLRGVYDAFPKSDNSKALAYSRGLGVGATAIDMLSQANKTIYRTDTLRTLCPELFIKGVIACVKGHGLMDNSEAIDCVNSSRYRDESEKFMQMNSTREGVVSLPNGLQYKILRQGNVAIATIDDAVSCIYKGAFTNGRMFDTSHGREVEFFVKDVIPGFSQALQIIPEGTVCKVYIPWQLGYGAQGTSRIPPYSVLVFDLEIVKVIDKTK